MCRCVCVTVYTTSAHIRFPYRKIKCFFNLGVCVCVCMCVCVSMFVLMVRVSLQYSHDRRKNYSILFQYKILTFIY